MKARGEKTQSKEAKYQKYRRIMEGEREQQRLTERTETTKVYYGHK